MTARTFALLRAVKGVSRPGVRTPIGDWYVSRHIEFVAFTFDKRGHLESDSHELCWIGEEAFQCTDDRLNLIGRRDSGKGSESEPAGFLRHLAPIDPTKDVLDRFARLGEAGRFSMRPVTIPSMSAILASSNPWKHQPVNLRHRTFASVAKPASIISKTLDFPAVITVDADGNRARLAHGSTIGRRRRPEADGWRPSVREPVGGTARRSPAKTTGRIP